MAALGRNKSCKQINLSSHDTRGVESEEIPSKPSSAMNWSLYLAGGY